MPTYHESTPSGRCTDTYLDGAPCRANLRPNGTCPVESDHAVYCTVCAAQCPTDGGPCMASAVCRRDVLRAAHRDPWSGNPDTDRAWANESGTLSAVMDAYRP